MNKNQKIKAVIYAIIIVACVYGFAGYPNTPISWTAIKNNFAERIHLGLDLKGGTYLIIQVVTDDAINAETDQTIETLHSELLDRQITSADLRKRDMNHIEIRGLDATHLADFRDLINEKFSGSWDIGSLAGEANGATLSMKPSVESELRSEAVRQTVQTLRNRIDALGVTEPVIEERSTGDYEVLVQLPNVNDPEKVDRVIGQPAILELKLVHDGPYVTREAALATKGGQIPPDQELLKSVERSAPGQPSGEQWYFVDRVASISGRDLKNARPQLDENGRPAVGFTLNNAGAIRFSQVTQQNIGKQLAIVLDHKIQSAPVIQGQISDSGQITGSFTQAQAQELALVLRSGALPASLNYLDKKIVGPSLGNDSIRQGIVASVVGFVVVVVFMIVYYKLSGVNAVTALFFNLIILLAAMAYFGATLTLPGIAGVILTIGMAVDSNVLVFERIREELRLGKAVVSAVDRGFSNAFRTIIDTHVTTVVSALFLFLFGTGPVKGFAVTLTVGLVANVFTAVYVSRLIFDYHLSGKQRNATLSI
ncbi:MAG: protein translocase subunit SecD [Acidobacteriia bacterium]|nr:protein translocase subunit SecD [Terriglobia bacterium]